MKNGEDDEGNEYYLVDEYDLVNAGLDNDRSDADLLSAYLDEYCAEDEENDSGAIARGRK